MACTTLSLSLPPPPPSYSNISYCEHIKGVDILFILFFIFLQEQLNFSFVDEEYSIIRFVKRKHHLSWPANDLFHLNCQFFQKRLTEIKLEHL